MSAKRCRKCGAERLDFLDFCLGCFWRETGHEPTDEELQLEGLESRWSAGSDDTHGAAVVHNPGIAAANTSSAAASLGYSTPFQAGGLWRSLLLGLIAVIASLISFQGLSPANGGTAALVLLGGITLACLVLIRAVGSSFYQAYPSSSALRSVLWIHDVFGTIAWTLFRMGIFMFIAFVAALFKQGVPGSGRSGKDDSAIGKDGVLYRKNGWTGNWEPVQGFFGKEQDGGLFGPNIKQGLFGPEEKYDGIFSTPQHGSAGEKLYERGH